ncbi:Na+/H+ antiporter subunit G [Erythrobacter dokdonensis]|jgi:multicomponent K+:H+ antiporter subunit G|uniref:Monovalent cation/proton antiporter, MnhG/PhaG subunit n=1 Tax=Erythrobacter dokdonensis DSW-74 TaxID=1300349 RepID=A0A1A7BDI9_9SPHN|nr:Na+/H+ antiporter subunit G [Erythrobacter dokdonensis]MEE4316125.1 Na+/H+ antiporter subunit G [Erythrobacter sp.]OBV10598.1 Monovalent cation/proton antiporter, MnhG/PhaG subunit [Erythrobacter dokdonensis DSW-74]
MSGGVSLPEILVSALIVLGGSFALIGSWGLVRLPSLMERLHGPTKATTLGLGGMLVGSVAFFQLVKGEWTTHELLVSLFLFVTAPIAANMIAKVHLHQLRLGKQPGPAGQPAAPRDDSEWATYESPKAGTPGCFEDE